MAVRPVFAISLDKNIFTKTDVEFEFFSGFSEKQARRSINSLHCTFLKKNVGRKILEISSKSEDELGVRLSAFNLMITSKTGKVVSVESVFQASKVFERGGPYKDLLDMPSIKAKKDERLKTSGKIISFSHNGKAFPTEPKTFFYNWIYVNALHLNTDLADQIMEYDAFTDIAFNPQKSINCQAEAVAIYVSLRKQGLLLDALKDKESFKKIVYPNNTDTTQCSQVSFFNP